MKVLETQRLYIRWLDTDDADFVFELLNSPSWIQFIGDRGIRTIEDARNYILNGPMDAYSKLGFGLYAVELKNSSTAIGICGLLKRDSLDDVDIGYAFLSRFWGQGYAYEAAHAIVEYGRTQLQLNRLVAITSVDNSSSVRLLDKLGFRFEGMIQHGSDTLKLFSVALSPPDRA
jgi:RimJ/RimL family protein N-acetyltransferase